MVSYPCPKWLSEIWAKSSIVSDVPGETLFSHTYQVLQRVADLRNLRPNLSESIGSYNFWLYLFWACMLHDFGKAASGFQLMLRNQQMSWGHRHEVLSLAFIDWLDEISVEDKFWIAAAIAYHHKDAADLSELTLVMDKSDDDPVVQMISELDSETLYNLWRWLNEYSHQWMSELGFSNSKANSIRIIDFNAENCSSKAYNSIRYYLNKLILWQESGNKSSVFKAEAILVRGHMVNSDHMASAHVEASTSPIKNPDRVIAKWGYSKDSLYAHQQECLQVKGSAILIAPTGSGKTEAALLWAASQAESELAVPRLIYCLPYQASMNAMYERLDTESFPGAVGLEHSRSVLAKYRRHLEEKQNSKMATKLAKWEKTLARLCCYPVRVLSPYQILKAPYRLKGYETLLTDCFGATFILDEIHAYAPNQLAQILATIKYLRETYHAKFLIMSATLPSMVTDKLGEVLGDSKLIKATDEVFFSFRRHKVFIRQGDIMSENVLNGIIEQAILGKKVLICCNTIARTQQIYHQLNEKLKERIPILVLHGRYNGRDRRIKEKSILAAAGGKDATIKQSLIVIATQVVEVSLNIDLDVLYSDPAPLEALIQRFGRINRRRIYDWAPVYVFTQPIDTVYKATLIEKTLKILQHLDGEFIEEQKVTEYLSEIYKGDILTEWEQEYQRVYKEFSDVCIKNLKAFASDKSLEDEFYKAFDSIEVLPVSLKEEYDRLIKENDPLGASELLVSLSWRQFSNMLRKRTAQVGVKGQPNLVNLPYDSENGLRIIF